MTEVHTDPFANACPQVVELARLLDGELSENRASALRGHLPACATCRARYSRLDAAATALPKAMVEQLDDAFVGQVMQRIASNGMPQHTTGRAAWWLGGGVALAAALVAVVLVTLPDNAKRNTVEEFVARGSTPTAWQADPPGFEVFTGRTSEQPLAGSTTTPHIVDANDGFRFRVSNPGDPRHLMIFGVDAAGEVHWFYPGWTDPQARPQSVIIEAGVVGMDLRDGVTPTDPAPGIFDIVALFLDTKLDVVTVEHLLNRHGVRGLARALNRVRPGAQMRQLVLNHVPKSDL